MCGDYVEYLNIKTLKLNSEQKQTNTQQTITIDTLTHFFDEGFHPSRATSPWSNFHGMGLCISLNCEKSVVYSLLLPLQPTPMAPKHQNIPRMTLPEPKLVENWLTLGEFRGLKWAY